MTDAISSILSQIRAHEMRMRDISADAAPSTAIPGPPGGVGGPAEARGAAGGFAQTMAHAIDNVSRTQQTASELQQAFELGDPKADLARVMVAMQQSQVAFRATVEVRNKLVQAYQEVMNMPI
ncbi:flagellar hook-basal body complex protein FliE [Cognatiluteimonas weifangensis]|uniref:Flagellar hook-basal body complex protein FliE n=1 Tax=Cognatiluteimonas weifangensis TaxID=2303539 RepID=A0A372DR49_9GAMM|nr:flagellar hook-basal body complex protein FliE [Luteimonas weifangensis]RFP62051.1 flagellar hook-basal body complex protein FliE [Luteimonas weifangensis]